MNPTRSPGKATPLRAATQRGTADSTGLGGHGEGGLPQGPLALLPPTAQRILAASLHVLDRDGYEGLTLRRIADEAGEQKSMIAYYFADKAGLIAAITDALWHDADVGLVRRIQEAQRDRQAAMDTLVETQRGYAKDTRTYIRFFELLHHILRDRELRTRIARLYDRYRSISILCLDAAGAPEDERVPMASLLIAVMEGMAVELVLAPADFWCEEAFSLWAAMVQARTRRSRPYSSALLLPRETEIELPGSTSMLEAVRGGEARPAARGILRAAYGLLRKGGLQAVTLDAVARRAHEPKSSVSHYFGDKRGLVSALVNEHIRERAGLLTTRLSKRSPARSRLDELLRLHESQVTDRVTETRVLYDLLPLLVRDEEFGRHERAYGEWYKATIIDCLREEGRVTPVLAASLTPLIVAVPLGLAIQTLMSPASFDAAAVLRLWTEMLLDCIGTVAQPVT